MRERGRSSSPQRGPSAQPTSRSTSAAARILALQRSAGNRAAGRALARWMKHPDPEQKGMMVPDSSAGEFGRFNPPQNT